jgi:hypothetical protein
MKARSLGKLGSMRITTLQEEKRFRFRLEFRECKPQEAIEFEMSAEKLMGLMVGLQKIQEHHKLPIPEQLRAKGRPNLVLVQSEEE